jgi:hypothetical protein
VLALGTGSFEVASESKPKKSFDTGPQLYKSNELESEKTTLHLALTYLTFTSLPRVSDSILHQ